MRAAVESGRTSVSVRKNDALTHVPGGYFRAAYGAAV